MRIHAKTLCIMGERYDDRVLTIKDGEIVSLESGTKGDLSAAYVSPGLFDIHIHGGCGFEVMDFSAEALDTWLGGLFQNGVTGVLPSVYTGPAEVMRSAVRKLHGAMRGPAMGNRAAAHIHGVHLEGPFISSARLGAMDGQFILPPDIASFQEIASEAEDVIRLVTLAPEVEGCETLIAYLNRRGITVQAGHTDATYEQARSAFLTGVAGVCHFFNGIRGIHHREPGILTAALLDDSVYCELIADMVHVHPAAARLLIKAKGFDRTVLISDAVKTTGLPDGTYMDNGQRIIVKDGESRVEGGGLNGGGGYLAGSVKKLVANGIPPEKALHMASNTARLYLNLKPVTLRPGSAAELAGLDENFNPLFTIARNALWKGGC